MDKKEARRTDRFVHFAIASAKLAWADAGGPEIQAERGGAIYATGIGGIETLLAQHKVYLERGPGRVSPFMVPMLMANGPAGHIAMWLGFTGPNLCTVSACASGSHAVGEGYRLIKDDMLDVCVVGGSESSTHPLTVAAFAQMTALTKNPDPATASRPFDAMRDGFVLSEGACACPGGGAARRHAARGSTRGRGLRRQRRRIPHHRPGPEGHGRRARDSMALATPATSRTRSTT